MVSRARLSPPAPPPRESGWHKPEWAGLPSSAVWGGDRRLEAETYLKSGSGVRLALESVPRACARFGEHARVWAPGRLKGIQVSSDLGTPFLAASQLFDVRPVIRKWLALEKTNSANDRFVERGTILVSCSGNVGRATLSRTIHEHTLITHDLLRIQPDDPLNGWIYAYLRSSHARAMMSAAQYGHIIKHLEPSHLAALPLPLIADDTMLQFLNKQVQRILDLRDEALALLQQAEALYEEGVGTPPPTDPGEEGFAVRASETLFLGRRRFDALPYNPVAAGLRQHLAHSRRQTLRALGFNVWLPTRFKRIPAEQGVELLGSTAPFEINPDAGRLIADGDFGDRNRARVEPGWLLVARSGQIYGVNGSVTLATIAHRGRVMSDDLIRIAPTEGTSINTGYVFIAMSHPTLGKPLMKSLAYGSSIPHIDVSDVEEFEVPRLASRQEDEIGRLALASGASLGEADTIEQELGMQADAVINEVLQHSKRRKV